MVAATARVWQLIVVTRNVRDFKALAVEVLNPFTSKT
jgi:predicted nucleic acid-binding protein